MIEDLWYFSWVMQEAQEAPFVRILFVCIPSSHFRLKQHICNTIMQSDNVVILLYFLKMQPQILIEGLRNLTRPEGYVYFLRSNHRIYYHHKNVKNTLMK